MYIWAMRLSQEKPPQFLKKLHGFVLVEKDEAILATSIYLENLKYFEEGLGRVAIVVDPAEEDARQLFEFEKEGRVEDREGDLGQLEYTLV